MVLLTKEKVKIVFFIILSFFTFILISKYLTHKEKQEFDEKWRNYLKNKEIRGFKNPYLTDELIYQYHGFDIDRNRYTNYCLFNIFSLQKTKKKVDLTYLNNYIEYLETPGRAQRFSRNVLKNEVFLLLTG